MEVLVKNVYDPETEIPLHVLLIMKKFIEVFTADKPDVVLSALGSVLLSFTEKPEGKKLVKEFIDSLQKYLKDDAIKGDLN